MGSTMMRMVDVLQLTESYENDYTYDQAKDIQISITNLNIRNDKRIQQKCNTCYEYQNVNLIQHGRCFSCDMEKLY